MVEFWYYFGWDDDIDEPKKVFMVDKKLSDSDPKELYSEEYGKKVPVKRWFNSAPALINMSDRQYKFKSKYKSFYERQREARARRGHVPLKEIVEQAGLTYKDSYIDPETGKEKVIDKPITDTVVPTKQWEKMPEDKRKICENLGILPQIYFESPGLVTPRNHHKLAKKNNNNSDDRKNKMSDDANNSENKVILTDKNGKSVERSYIEYFKVYTVSKD